ncbi:MAG: DUF6979 family protein [Longimicrobiaceae bacterium]
MWGLACFQSAESIARRPRTTDHCVVKPLETFPRASTAMSGTKIEQVTATAWERAKTGSKPDEAWLEALAAVYPPEMLLNQIKHSCPKWAFSILCHEGWVAGVRRGSCPAAVGLRSAAITMRALERLQHHTSLASDKRELKRLVFGAPGSAAYRKPNDEVEVLLALRKLGALITPDIK